MNRDTLLRLERKTHKLLMRLFELTNGNTQLMAVFGEAIEGLDWTDEECDQVEDYALGQDYITRQSMGDTKTASFSLTTSGRTLAKQLILDESGDSSIGNVTVPNDKPWFAMGNPYSGGTVVYDPMTGQAWQPPTKLTVVDRKQTPDVGVTIDSSSAAATPHTQRIQHLQVQLQEHLDLLHKYEQQESVEEDPRRLKKIQQNIAREKEAIKRKQNELTELSHPGKLP